MRNVQLCMKQVRLVVLQLYFLSVGVKVIYMLDEGVDQFIKFYFCFFEVSIYFMINVFYIILSMQLFIFRDWLKYKYMRYRLYIYLC